MRPYPVDNLWRRKGSGCWLAVVTGRHDTYVFDREFVRGVPNKSRGILTYSLADLGGDPCWVVRSTMGDRELLGAYPHGWESFGEVGSRSILAVFEAGPPGSEGAWDGTRCACGDPAIGGELCETCSEEAGDSVRIGAALAAMPDGDPF